MSGNPSQRGRYTGRGRGNNRDGGFQGQVIVVDSTIATRTVRTARLYHLDIRRMISYSKFIRIDTVNFINA